MTEIVLFKTRGNFPRRDSFHLFFLMCKFVLLDESVSVCVRGRKGGLWTLDFGLWTLDFGLIQRTITPAVFTQILK